MIISLRKFLRGDLGNVFDHVRATQHSLLLALTLAGLVKDLVLVLLYLVLSQAEKCPVKCYYIPFLTFPALFPFLSLPLPDTQPSFNEDIAASKMVAVLV